MEINPSEKIVAMLVVRDMDHLNELINESHYAFLLEGSTQQQVNKAFNAILKEKSFISSELSGILLTKLAKGKKLSKHVVLHDQLTSREKEIAHLICDSHTTKEIAQRLTLSPKTISTHRKNILKKLELRNTAALVKYTINFLTQKSVLKFCSLLVSCFYDTPGLV